MHSADKYGDDIRAEFPWALFLPPDEIPRMLADFEAAESVAALAQVVREWRATAEVHADPDLYVALTAPTGDYGTVLSPEQFDELMESDEPDPAPALERVARRVRQFVRREQ